MKPSMVSLMSSLSTLPPLPRVASSADYLALHSRFPTTTYLRRAAPKGAPVFAYEFGDSGAGDDVGIAHNWSAFDALKFKPRYGVVHGPGEVSTTLFGQSYGAPIGMSPMGGLSLVWPGADLIMARAAQRMRTPYTLSVAGGATIEDIVRVAPDVAWMQMYRFANNDHAIGWDMLRRCQEAGVRAVVMTLDVPVRTTRSREARSGIAQGFHPTPRMLWEIATRPRWLLAILRHGYPRFEMLRGYVGPNAGTNEVIRFARREMGGGFSWEDVARYRDRWKGPLVLKGVLHPEDAEKAVALGVDGLWISNHGGRQIETLMPSIECLPAIAATVRGRAALMLDSGVRSGHDAAKAIALGADVAFAGKAFLWSLAALGDRGPDYALELMIDELRSAVAQTGAATLQGLRGAQLWRLNAAPSMLMST